MIKKIRPKGVAVPAGTAPETKGEPPPPKRRRNWLKYLGYIAVALMTITGLVMLWSLVVGGKFSDPWAIVAHRTFWLTLGIASALTLIAFFQGTVNWDMIKSLLWLSLFGLLVWGAAEGAFPQKIYEKFNLRGAIEWLMSKPPPQPQTIVVREWRKVISRTFVGKGIPKINNGIYRPPFIIVATETGQRPGKVRKGDKTIIRCSKEFWYKFSCSWQRAKFDEEEKLYVFEGIVGTIKPGIRLPVMAPKGTVFTVEVWRQFKRRLTYTPVN
ncbi:hypothetical protein D6821_00295 [Candidatus Parcubacteria bacterium]|nr:MAG: hypothetical protein D6821_00295 [Candidatus Parcubacteria bacterium]